MIAAKLPSALLSTALLLSGPAAMLVPTSSFAQNSIETQRVQFQSGATGTTVQGSIQGYQTVDYILSVRAGQSMNVNLSTDNSANYFNVLAPGETEVALFNSSIDGNQYQGTLSESGDYKIRVYLMRSAARRDEVANYQLEMAVSSLEASNADDATVAGTAYNATGDLPCSMGGGQPTGSCPFGVTRQGNGGGIVTVTKPDGQTRAIFFENGRATGYDQSQADRGEFSATRQDDLSIIRIGPERYEIPDVVILGD